MKLTHFQFIPVARQHKVVHKTGPFASVGARPSVTDCACVKERGTTCVTDQAEPRSEGGSFFRQFREEA